MINPLDEPPDEPRDVTASGTTTAPDTGPRSRFELVRERFKRSGAQLEAKYEDIRTHRDESNTIDVAFRVIETDRRVAGGLIAGGMAFRIFVVLVPFAFVLVTVFGFLGESMNPDDPVALARSFGMTGLIASAVGASTAESTVERVFTLLAALYALLWATWTLIRATRAVHGLAWGFQQPPRLARPWKPTLLVVVGMFSAFLADVGISRLSDLVNPAAELLVRLLVFGAIFAAWIGVSSLLPRAAGTTWRSLVPGALLMAVGLEVLQLLTVYFFSRYIASKTEAFGSIGASIAFLLWAYLAGRLIVTGAFLNAARWRQSEQHSEL
jgi:membrane protein